MALYMYRYFQTVDALPDTSGPLSASLSPAAIKDVNEAVRSPTRVTKPRGKYAIFTPEQQAVIGEYASLHGNQVAIRRVSKQLGEAVHAKFKNTKFYSKGNSVIYVKICTYQHFLLYSNTCTLIVVHTLTVMCYILISSNIYRLTLKCVNRFFHGCLNTAG